MASTSISVTVELVGRPGRELWPHPGRVLAVGPDHTFRQLGSAIIQAFGRWSREEPALQGRDLSGVLQHAGDAMLVALRADRDRARGPAGDVVRQLRERDQIGDEELADELDAMLRGDTPAGREVPVDMDLLTTDMQGNEGESKGLLNIETGSVYPGQLFEFGDIDDEESDLEDEAWHAYSDELLLGRARVFLSDLGIRAVRHDHELQWSCNDQP